MATKSLNLEATRTVRGEGEVTLATMLKRVESIFPGKYSLEDLASIGAAKVLATTQDNSRRKAGQAPERFYAVDLSAVTEKVKARERLESAAAVIHGEGTTIAPGKAEPVKAKPPTVKRADPAKAEADKAALRAKLQAQIEAEKAKLAAAKAKLAGAK